MSRRTNYKSRTCGRGFTLVEAVMSLLVVSIMLVAAIRATGASSLLQYKSAQRATGRLLATGLMNDILPLNYEDPSSVLFGVEANETTTSKTNYDDVDDFNGWSESPPQESDGTVMSGMTSWTRSVAVDRVNPSSLSQVLSTETGMKRITVTVKYKTLTVATLVAYRSKAP